MFEEAGLRSPPFLTSLEREASDQDVPSALTNDLIPRGNLFHVHECKDMNGIQGLSEDTVLMDVAPPCGYALKVSHVTTGWQEKATYGYCCLDAEKDDITVF